MIVKIVYRPMFFQFEDELLEKVRKELADRPEEYYKFLSSYHTMTWKNEIISCDMVELWDTEHQVCFKDNAEALEFWSQNIMQINTKEEQKA